jgi:hypothetical protein
MGLSPFKTSGCTCEAKLPKNAPPRLTGVDPRRFKVLRSSENGDWLIVMVNYPDASNYEGNKILVFQGVTLEKLQTLDFLDPHFCEKAHIVPRARFEPTKEGWKMAICFVATMVHREARGLTLRDP